MCITVKDEKQNEFKKPTPKEFSEMLKDIGFVKSTHEYKNYYIERDLVKHKQFDEEVDVNNEDKNISNQYYLLGTTQFDLVVISIYI